ncbi:tyrosine-type recombinase/integrase [Sporosarcina cascadiensis]|uniref:tyrosine-type recombinase/integrase n=1 Tax=Sporosarcina cascadiensis TaxID=2660747 RepID=UPI00189196B4|nr:tyrosine-type recombinase/integrase [Sporosarcina cascadiensis]
MVHFEKLTKSPYATQRHRSVLRRFFSTRQTQFFHVTKEEILNWLTEQTKQRSDKTVEEYRKTMRAFYNFAVEAKRMEQSPLSSRQNYWEIHNEISNVETKAAVNQFLLSQKENEVSKATIIGQRSTLRQFFSQEEKIFSAITTVEIRDWLAGQEQKRTARTIGLYLKKLRAFYTYCVQAKYMDQSPVPDKKTPPSKRKYGEVGITLANQENLQVINRFLSSLEKANKGRSSIAVSKRYLQYFFKENSKVFSDIQPKEIEDWMHESEFAKNKSITTGVRNTLRHFYEYCLKRGHVKENPVKPEEYWVLTNPLMAPENVTAINAYLLQLKQRDRSERIIKSEKYKLQRFFLDIELIFSEVKAEDVEGWLIRRQAICKKNTLSAYISGLRSFYQFCVQQKYIHQSPAPAAGKRKAVEKDYWQIKELFVNEETQRTINEYLSHLKLANLSPLTIRNYKRFLANFFKNRTECYTELTPNEMLEWLKERQETLSKSTVNYRLSVLSSFYQFCVDEGYVDRIPIKKRWYARLPKPLPRYLSKEEVAKMRSASETDTPRNRAIFELLVSTGCRVDELVTLDRSDVDIEERRAHVTGKGRKIRPVNFTDGCSIALERYLDSRTDSDPAAFVSKWGYRLSRTTIYKIIRRLGEEAGIQDSLYPHRLRHTFATDLRTKGADLAFIANELGHKSRSTTRIYARTPKWKLIKSYRMHMG